MIRTRPQPMSSSVVFDAAIGEALRLVRSDSSAVMLYGSRARGTARPDSDIDILALVDRCPGSISHGHVSVNYYTSHDITQLAKQGSLFILHLIREGVTLVDDRGCLRAALAAYAERSDYEQLREDLAVVLSALAVKDRDCYYDGLRRAGVWAARSAVYVACAEQGTPTFDMAEACRLASVPHLACLLRGPGPFELEEICTLGFEALGIPTKKIATDLVTLAVAEWNSHPTAARLLESIVAGQSQLEYTHLTLPLV